MTYYCEHGICPMETQLPNATDTIHINKDLHLQQVAEVCNINLDQLRSLNPQYKKDIIPLDERFLLLVVSLMATVFLLVRYSLGL